MFMFNKNFKILTLYFKNYDFDLDFIFQLSGSYLINYYLRGLIYFKFFGFYGLNSLKCSVVSRFWFIDQIYMFIVIDFLYVKLILTSYIYLSTLYTVEFNITNKIEKPI